MADPSPPSFWNRGLLIGAILILSLSAAAVLWLPLDRCLGCFGVGIWNSRDTVYSCGQCGGRGKVPLSQTWRGRNELGF